jgi:repressor LexA
MAEMLTQKELDAARHIRNWLVHHGHAPSVRDLMKALGYSSPRSAALILESLIEKGFAKRRRSGELQFLKDPEEEINNARTIDVPLVGAAACGMPILAQENVEAMISVSKSLTPSGSRCFLLRAKGDSMTEAGIQDGDLVLVRQQSTAKNGDLVVALIDDEATIKEFYRSENAVVLRPKSRNKKHQPIILREDFRIQGIVITAIPNPE